MRKKFKLVIDILWKNTARDIYLREKHFIPNEMKEKDFKEHTVANQDQDDGAPTQASRRRWKAWGGKKGQKRMRTPAGCAPPNIPIRSDLANRLLLKDPGGGSIG